MVAGLGHLRVQLGSRDSSVPTPNAPLLDHIPTSDPASSFYFGFQIVKLYSTLKSNDIQAKLTELYCGGFCGSP